MSFQVLESSTIKPENTVSLGMKLAYNADMPDKPSIFDYSDYRAFIADWYNWKKLKNQNFSHRLFAKTCGYKSSNLLSLIMAGKRHMPLLGIHAFAKAFDFTEKERRYLETLVHYSRAENPAEQADLLKKLSKHTTSETVKLKVEQYEFLSNWFYGAIRELVNLKDFEEAPRWISLKLREAITSQQAAEALKLLLHLGLIERAPSGKLKTNSKVITTGDEVASLSAFRAHYQILGLAMKSLRDRSQSEGRNFNGVTFTIKQEDFKKVAAKLKDLRDDFVHFLMTLSEDPDSEDALYHAIFNAFPLST